MSLQWRIHYRSDLLLCPRNVSTCSIRLKILTYMTPHGDLLSGTGPKISSEFLFCYLGKKKRGKMLVALVELELDRGCHCYNGSLPEQCFEL